MTLYRAYEESSPPSAATADDLSYNLGVEFSVDSEVWYIGGSYWQPSENSPNLEPKIVSLWTVDTADTGTLVWSRESLDSNPDEWNDVSHEEPFQLTIGQRYKQCTQHLSGRYPATAGYFSTGDGASNLVVGPLTIYNSGNSISGQGTFVQSSSLVFPDTEFGSANYWNDVIVSDVDPNPGANLSISDRARDNMLDFLGFTEPRLESNVDLMRLVLATPDQDLVPATSKNAAGHYIDYLLELRG